VLLLLQGVAEVISLKILNYNLKILQKLSSVMMAEFKFASTFKIVKEGKRGGQGSVFVSKIRKRQGPVGLLKEGDPCAVKAVKSNM